MDIYRIVCSIVIILLHKTGDTVGELRLVQTVFRHGDRAPDDLSKFSTNYYPNNPYTPRDHYPIPDGGLTNIGKERSFELGKFYGRTYGKWLGGENAATFFASVAPRAQESAALVATGLFPSNPDEKWSESLQLRNISIRADKSMKESWYYFASAGPCSNFRKAQKTVEETEPDVINYLKDNEKFYEHLSFHAGFNGSYEMAYVLYITLLTQSEVGLKPPKWSEGIFPEGKLKEEAPMVFVLRGFTDEVKKFGGGVWLKMWLENIEKFIQNNKTDSKLLIWSGHDQNIAALLVALDNFYEPHVPPYNSAVILELHEIKQQYYVKILYKRDTDAIPFGILDYPDFLCPLEVLKARTASFIPQGDAAQICGTMRGNF